MLNNLKVKLICGFRRDQEHTIDGDEAHKAYTLFLNPHMRAVFKNGLALIGEDIREIVPDYHASMGWNPTHQLTSDDWNEIRNKNVDFKLRAMLSGAQEVAKEITARGEFAQLQKPLTQLLHEAGKPLLGTAKVHGLKSTGDLLSGR